MIKYSIGFLFSQNRESVALIKKNKPEWQVGLYNAPGGKIENYESPLACIIREFAEETGVHYTNWLPRIEILYKNEKPVEDVLLHIFNGFSDDVFSCMTMTEETVHVMTIEEAFQSPLVYNLSWLIPLCLDAYIEGTFRNFHLSPSGKYQLTERV